MQEKTEILLDDQHPHIAYLTLNRPEKRNALSICLMKQICRAIENVRKNQKKRILVIKAEGPIFCAGMDLDEAGKQELSKISARMISQLLYSIYSTPLITIAVLHGDVFAGGAGLISACDFVIADDKVRIGFPEIRRGMVACFVMILLGRQILDRHIRELLLIGETIAADRAKEIGLINQIVPTSELSQAVEALIDKLLLGAPGAMSQTKKMINELYPSVIENELKRVYKDHLIMRNSAEAHEGMQAFLEKRKPNWESDKDESQGQEDSPVT